jgi:argininosuccinate synthase
VPRTIFAFNGDLESRLALHWLVHERGHEVVALSLNLGQEQYLEPLGELALELGAVAARIVDRRAEFLRDFALPVLQADAVYQGGCFLGSALARFVIAREMVHAAREQGGTGVAHSSATKGNDQVRLEAALATLAPDLEVIAPVRLWNLRTLDDKRNYARRRGLPLDEPNGRPVTVDRNLWGASTFVADLTDPWEEPPPEVFVMTRIPAAAPDQPVTIALGFEEGVPRTLDGHPIDLVPLVRELNRLGGEHAVGRSDVVEDRLFGIKTRELYEAPAATILRAALRDLESLVHSRELRLTRESLGRRYAELVYAGQWFHDLRQALQAFFVQTQRHVSGEVRLRLFKGSCSVVGRRSPYSLYDGKIAGQADQEWFDARWASALTALVALPARLAALRQPSVEESASGWAAP